MNDIKEYLENQLRLSEELNVILKKVDLLEDSEKELHYHETEDLRHKLDSVNVQNVNAAADRISLLKNKLNVILSDPEIKKNGDIFYPAYNLNNKLIKLSSELNSLEKKINKCYNASLPLLKNNIHNVNDDSFSLKNSDIGNAENDNFSIKDSAVNNAEQDIPSPDDNTDHNINEDSLPAGDKQIYNINKDSFSSESNKNAHDSIRGIGKNKKSAFTSTEQSDKKLEFKFGANVLNIIGVILILISLITFGKYVYTNYMSDLLKGIFLFAISGCVLFSGEKVFKKKLPKFSSGISALGVGGLYASIMINYLVLDTINSAAALILTVIITGISIFISYGDSSNIVRMIALLGAYMCLFPMDYLRGTTSYITVAILITISIANGCFPIRNKIFLIYSSIINVAFCEAIMAAGFLEEPALKIYLVAALIINNIMYMKLLKDDDSRYYLVGFISSLSLIVLILANGELILRLTCLLVSIASYYTAKNKLKTVHLINAGLTMTSLLFIYREDLGMMFTVLYIMLMALTMVYIIKKDANKLLQYYFMGLVILGMFWFIMGSTLEIILYGTAFAAMIWFLSDKYKNNILLISFKHTYLVLIAFIITFMNRPFILMEYNIFLCGTLSIIYIILTTNVDKLKHDSIKQSNIIVISTSFIICSLAGFNHIIPCIISLALGSAMIVLFTSEKYVDAQCILQHKLIIYSLYSTYGICSLFSVIGLNNTLANILLSIILMIIALGNVWVGFKADTVEIRRYGLILSLIVCAKLLLVDFYSFDFVMKAMLFLVVGVIALAISYIYSKLENELKNKK